MPHCRLKLEGTTAGIRLAWVLHCVFTETFRAGRKTWLNPSTRCAAATDKI